MPDRTDPSRLAACDEQIAFNAHLRAGLADDLRFGPADPCSSALRRAEGERLAAEAILLAVHRSDILALDAEAAALRARIGVLEGSASAGRVVSRARRVLRGAGALARAVRPGASLRTA